MATNEKIVEHDPLPLWAQRAVCEFGIVWLLVVS